MDSTKRFARSVGLRFLHRFGPENTGLRGQKEVKCENKDENSRREGFSLSVYTMIIMTIVFDYIFFKLLSCFIRKLRKKLGMHKRHMVCN